MFSKTETNIRMVYNLLVFLDIVLAAITTKETTYEQQTGANIQKLHFSLHKLFSNLVPRVLSYPSLRSERETGRRKNLGTRFVFFKILKPSNALRPDLRKPTVRDNYPCKKFSDIFLH